MMSGLSILIVYFFILFVLPFFLPLLMWNYRALFICAIVTGVPLAFHVGRLSHLMSYPDGPALDLGAFQITALFLGLGLLASGITLFMRAKGLSFKKRLAFAGAIFALPFIFMGTAVAWQDWDRRAPDEACFAARHEVQLNSARYSFPLAPFLVIYTQATVSKGVYYLSNNKYRRAFCNATVRGTEPISATKLWFRIHGHESWETYCHSDKNLVPETQFGSFCDTRIPQLDAKEYILQEIHVFLADKIVLGDFGGVRSTFLASKDLPALDKKDAFYVSHPEQRTPDGHPLTAMCYDWGNPQDYCVVAYPRGDGTHLMFEFHTKRAEIAQRTAELDAWSRQFLQKFDVSTR